MAILNTKAPAVGASAGSKILSQFQFFICAEPGGASWIWRSLLQVRDIILARLCWGVKCGDSINIWCDPWVPNVENFVPLLKRGMVISRHINRVKDLIRVGVDETQSWNEELIRNTFDICSAKAILKISLPPRPSADIPLWIHNHKGNLTVKSAYAFIINSRGPSNSPLTV